MNTIEKMTMPELMEALKQSADKYNLSEDGKERAKLIIDMNRYVELYNEASLLTSYAIFMEAEKPLIELAKAYYYDVVSVKEKQQKQMIDGVAINVKVMCVEKSNKRFDVAKFIEWTENGNNCVAASEHWRDKVDAARMEICELKRLALANDKTYEIKKGKVKKALQPMFDALVKVETPNGNNAVIANGEVANWVIEFGSTRKDSKVNGKAKLKGSILSKATWRTILLDMLSIAVDGKNYVILFGDETEEEVEVEAEAVEETETK